MQVVNMTASLRLAGRLDLSLLLQKYPEIAKRNRGFDSVSLKMTPVTALIFSSGAVVLVGAKSDCQLDNAEKELVQKACMDLLGVRKVHQMVCTFKFEPLRLSHVYEKLRYNNDFKEVSFEPELFPALTLRIKDTKKKVCIFSSGRTNIVGCHNTEEADEVKDLISKAIL